MKPTWFWIFRPIVGALFFLVVGCYTQNRDQKPKDPLELDVKSLQYVRGITKLFCNDTTWREILLDTESYDNLNAEERLQLESKCSSKKLRLERKTVGELHVMDGKLFLKIVAYKRRDTIIAIDFRYNVPKGGDVGTIDRYGVKYVDGIPYLDTLINWFVI